LFISGAGLPTWIWDGVRTALPHDVDTAVARRPHGTHASLADYADAAAAAGPWPTFAVVAHSSGGVVASELMSRHPGRVTGILGISAVVPRAGRSFIDTMPFPSRFVLSTVLRLLGTKPPARVIRTRLASGLPDATAKRIVTDFDPESLRLYRDPTSPRDLPETRGYLATTQDNEVTAPIQRTSADALQAMWCDKLATGHLPMLQDPVQVSQAVRRLLATIDGPAATIP
jgi:pimeloyl-ACP methyl ester carboxylesterase